MTDEKKITAICQECNEQFEYVLKPGYPRKYCFKCSEAKKASYAEKFKSDDEIKFDKDMSNEAPIPVERPGEAAKTAENGSVKEYHLTQEAQRSNALRCAIEWDAKHGLMTFDEFWGKVKEFKEYIEHGEKHGN